MAATNTDLTLIFTGEDRDIQFTVKDSAGSAVDITGWAVSFVCGSVTKTVGSGIALTTPGSGVLTVSLAAADTTAIGAGSTSYRLRRTDTGYNTVLAYGNVLVTA